MESIERTQRETDAYLYRKCVQAIQRADIALMIAEALEED